MYENSEWLGNVILVFSMKTVLYHCFLHFYSFSPTLLKLMLCFTERILSDSTASIGKGLQRSRTLAT